MLAFFDGRISAGLGLNDPLAAGFRQTPEQHAIDFSAPLCAAQRHLLPTRPHQNDDVHVVVIVLHPVLVPAHRIVHILEREECRGQFRFSGTSS